LIDTHCRRTGNATIGPSLTPSLLLLHTSPYHTLLLSTADPSNIAVGVNWIESGELFHYAADERTRRFELFIEPLDTNNGLTRPHIESARAAVYDGRSMEGRLDRSTSPSCRHRCCCCCCCNSGQSTSRPHLTRPTHNYQLRLQMVLLATTSRQKDRVARQSTSSTSTDRLKRASVPADSGQRPNVKQIDSSRTCTAPNCAD